VTSPVFTRSRGPRHAGLGSREPLAWLMYSDLCSAPADRHCGSAEPVRTLDVVDIATLESPGEPLQLMSGVTGDRRVLENTKALGYFVDRDRLRVSRRGAAHRRRAVRDHMAGCDENRSGAGTRWKPGEIWNWVEFDERVKLAVALCRGALDVNAAHWCRLSARQRAAAAGRSAQSRAAPRGTETSRLGVIGPPRTGRRRPPDRSTSRRSLCPLCASFMVHFNRLRAASTISSNVANG
jgi:hypothetical protein